ncbi:MAG TPA: hypothetical protein VFG69_04360 [Nannocystaceae bacterium]|nr:hypothetical protein [Nannocystaceae bacterium]
MRPRALRLVGTYRAFDRVLDDDERLVDQGSVFVGYELEIPDARRIDLLDGRIAFVFEGLVEDGNAWEGRLESRGPGSRWLTGVMRSPGQPTYRIEGTLWVAPDGDEWLLLGTYLDPQDGERIDLAITFSVQEPDDEGEPD